MTSFRRGRKPPQDADLGPKDRRRETYATLRAQGDCALMEWKNSSMRSTARRADAAVLNTCITEQCSSWMTRTHPRSVCAML